MIRALTTCLFVLAATPVTAADVPPAGIAVCADQSAQAFNKLCALLR